MSGEKVPAFCGTDDKVQSVSINEIAEAMRPHVTSGSLREVVYTGCCTIGLAEELRRIGVTSVVCWDTEMQDDDQTRLLGKTYAEARAAGETAEAAFNASVKAPAEAKAKAAAVAEAKAARDATLASEARARLVEESLSLLSEEETSMVVSGCEWEQMSGTPRLRRLEDLGLSAEQPAAKSKIAAAEAQARAAEAQARAAADAARQAFLEALESNASVETVLAMITPEVCRPNQCGEPVALSRAANAPEAVVAKLIEVTVKTYGRGALMCGGSGNPGATTPLHSFALSCKSEKNLALLIAASPGAVKKGDFEGDPPYDCALDNKDENAAAVKAMLQSAETADGLERIVRLADEVMASLSVGTV